MNIQRRLSMLLLILAAACAGGALAQDVLPEYKLGAGDTIRIQVFQNANLTLETRVSENGIITYPLIGAVRVGGLSTADAERRIATALESGGFINQPQVNVLLLQNRGNQVSVLGLVNRPGRFPLETFTTRVSEMVAIAGGIAPVGADVVILSGTRDGKPFQKEIDIAGVFLDKRMQDDVVVRGGDAIYVHRAPMFFVYGEVQRPGAYRVERDMSIRHALALGGGLTPRGTERGLRVFRRKADGTIESVSPSLSDAVRPDDVFHVGESLF